MHNHQCRRCEEYFVCGAGGDCFEKWIVCDDCFMKHDLKWWAITFVLGLIAVGLTILLWNLMQSK